MKVSVNGMEFDVGDKPITIIVPGPNAVEPVEYPADVVRIDPAAADAWLKQVEEFHPRTDGYIRKMWPGSFGFALTPDRVRKQAGCVQHFAGLIDLTLRTIDAGQRWVWVRPESNLHPAQQLILADIIVELWAGRVAEERQNGKV